MNWREYFVNFAVQNNLVQITAPDGIVGPDLAKSWDISADGKTITFTLAQNVAYHDGTKFDATVAKWNIDRVMDKAVGANQAAQLSSITAVEAVDASTLKITMDKPWRPIFASLAERPGYMPSPTAIQKTNSYSNRNGEFGKNPVGTGPYKFKEWVIAQRVVLDRFDGYFGGRPYLDSVVLQHFGDYEVGVSMVRTGEAMMLETEIPVLSRLALIRSNSNLKLVGGPTGRIYYIQFTVDVAPYDNKALREAMAYAIDRKALVNAILSGEGVPAYQIEGKGWGSNPNAKYYDYDVQKAKSKLTEAGYPNGLNLKYWCQANTDEQELCGAIQAQARAVGINLDIQLIESSTLWTVIYAKPDHGVWMWNTWWSPRGDPHNRLQIMIDSRGFQTKTLHYKNQEVDSLMDQGAQMYDVAKAQSIYWKIQEIATKDVPYVWMMHPNNYMAMDKKVMGFDWAPDIIPRIRGVWISK